MHVRTAPAPRRRRKSNELPADDRRRCEILELFAEAAAWAHTGSQSRPRPLGLRVLRASGDA
jgi:hypothetical protein